MNLVPYGSMMIPSLEDIAERFTDPVGDEPVDIIPGLVPKSGQVIIAGETNVGKSLMAIEIISSLVTGEKLWNEIEPVGRAKKVLYVLGEHYTDVVRRLWLHTKLPLTDEVFLIGPEQLNYDKWLVTNGRPNLHAIDKFKKWAEGMDVIVWDPFASFMTGEGAENDNIGARLVLDSMSLISQGAGASCIVLAHQGKPIMGKDGVEQSRKSYAIRGASGIEDAATNIFYMGRSKTESGSAITAADGELFTLSCRKYKGIAPPEYRLLRDPGTLTHTLLGNRPYTELKRIVIQGKLGKLMAAIPSLTTGQAIEILAAMSDSSIRTVKRDLGMG